MDPCFHFLRAFLYLHFLTFQSLCTWITSLDTYNNPFMLYIDQEIELQWHWVNWEQSWIRSMSLSVPVSPVDWLLLARPCLSSRAQILPDGWQLSVPGLLSLPLLTISAHSLSHLSMSSNDFSFQKSSHDWPEEAEASSASTSLYLQPPLAHSLQPTVYEGSVMV